LAYAYIQTPGNGTNCLFSVSFPFIVRAHVKVYLGYDVAAGTGTELVDGTGFSWLSNTQIQTTVAPALGTTLTVIRKTPNGSQLVAWAPGSPPTQADLNTADLQSLYVVQEQADLTVLAVTTATAAAAAANAAAAAVGAALLYQPIAAVANIPASPTASQRIEISNTTGLGSFTPLSGKPAGFIGGTDVKARLIYGTPTAAAWNWVDYFPVNPDGRYATLAGATFTGAVAVPSLNGGPLAGFRDRVINGGFDIWQTGTVFTSSGYGADQWNHVRVGTTHTVSQQSFALGQTDVPGEPEFFCRTVVSSVAGANNYSILMQPLEGVRTYAGQQITLSFWAKMDAIRNIAFDFSQIFGTGGSPSADVTGIGANIISVGTSWQKVPITATIPSISGKTLGTDNNNALRLNIWFDAGSSFNSRTNSLGQQSGTFDIGEVHIEPGPVATERGWLPPEIELIRCQRYRSRVDAYIRMLAPGANPLSTMAAQFQLPVQMRNIPTLAYSGSTSGSGLTLTAAASRGFTFGGTPDSSGALYASIIATAQL
jgi:hypothetical protein